MFWSCLHYLNPLSSKIWFGVIDVLMLNIYHSCFVKLWVIFSTFWFMVSGLKIAVEFSRVLTLASLFSTMYRRWGSFLGTYSLLVRACVCAALHWGPDLGNLLKDIRNCLQRFSPSPLWAFNNSHLFAPFFLIVIYTLAISWRVGVKHVKNLQWNAVYVIYHVLAAIFLAGVSESGGCVCLVYDRKIRIWT